MREFKCQESATDYLSASHQVVTMRGNKMGVYIETVCNDASAAVFLNKDDAAELGRYLIQLAEGGE